MTITWNLAPDLEAALRPDAEAQDRPAETVAAERLAAFYEHDDTPEPEPKAVEAITQALARLDAGDRGTFLDEYTAVKKLGLSSGLFVSNG